MIFDNNGMAHISAEFMFQTHEENHPSPPNILPPCPPQLQDLHGASPAQMMRRSMSFSGVRSKYEEMLQAEDDVSDDGSPLGERKKRLNIEQVKALEKSFELQGNKLESERKMQLARALGLQPRQVAIWFQNRRARCKTKQLEKDYDLLKRKFEALKADNDSLLSQNKTLQAQLLALKGESTGIGPINLNKGTEVSWGNGSENSCDVNLGTTTTPPPTIDSPVYSRHQSNKHLFQFSSAGPTTITHLLQGSSRSDHQSQKIDRTVPDESFCNDVFTSCIEHDQPGFWPWPEHQN